MWRISNKKTKGFTWRSQKPCRRSRLDYFLLSDDLLSLDPKMDILPAYKSDHNPIMLTFIKSRQNRGKGLWKFNNELLKNQDFIDMIKEELFLLKSIYALPVYDPEYVKNNHGDRLDITISDTLFLDTLLCQLRGAIIDFSRKLKKKERAEEKTLLDQIAILESETETTSILNEQLLTAKSQLEKIREKRIKGSMIRSRAQLSQDWEKPSKYFLNLEKRNYINKSIPSLTVEGKKVTDSESILKQQHRFYSDLYLSKGVKELFTGEFSQYLDNMQQLSDNSKKKTRFSFYTQRIRNLCTQ